MQRTRNAIFISPLVARFKNRVTSSRPRFWVIFLAVILYLAWSANYIFRSSFIGLDGQRYFSLFDDAMISMRYAWNFSHGYGLVWTKGVIVPWPEQ